MKNKYTFTERVLADLTLYAGWEKTAVSEEEILPFTDVKSSAWYYNAVEYVYNNKLMQGMTKTTFEPETTLTRAMFVTILHRAKGTPEAGEKSDFADVADGAWYKDAVDWALEEGIAVGYDEETFAPNDTITREQMASMLFRYVKKAGYDMSGSADLSEFTDKEKISDWALEAVKWAIDNGIINGMTADEIAPQGIATRAQCAQILMQARKNLNLMGSDE
ncbi:MAG: S-layer homology domain-containing protein [Clostridia bacterium]|nr:S-layer homology domain-containing protein [Clostridia bacterium]